MSYTRHLHRRAARLGEKTGQCDAVVLALTASGANHKAGWGWAPASGKAACVSQLLTYSPQFCSPCQATALGGGLGQDSSLTEHKLSWALTGNLTFCEAPACSAWSSAVPAALPLGVGTKCSSEGSPYTPPRPPPGGLASYLEGVGHRAALQGLAVPRGVDQHKGNSGCDSSHQHGLDHLEARPMDVPRANTGMDQAEGHLGGCHGNLRLCVTQ